MAKKKKYKVYKKGGESFKPHMMYNTKTGESYLANTYDEHARMDAMGYGHEPMMRHGGMPCYECGGHVKYQDGGEGQAIYNPNTDTYSSRYSLPEFQVTANDPRIANAVRQGQSDFLRGAFESMSAPQKQMVEMFTGKQQFPSEAMGIENPYGAMAADMILDPMSLIGIGALGKMSKVPKGLKAMTKGVKKLDPYSRLDDLTEEVRKEGLDWYRELAAEEAEKVAKFKRGVDQEITKATIGRQPLLNRKNFALTDADIHNFDELDMRYNVSADPDFFYFDARPNVGGGMMYKGKPIQGVNMLKDGQKQAAMKGVKYSDMDWHDPAVIEQLNIKTPYRGRQAFNELYPNKYGGTMKYEFGGSSTAPQNINTGDIGRTNIDLMTNHLAENTIKNILQQRDELVAQMTEQMYQYGGGFNYDERLKENPNRAFGAMAAQNYYDAQNKAMQSGKNFWNSVQDFAQNYQTPRPYQPPMEKVESKKADLSGLYTPTDPQLAVPQGGFKGAADYMMYGGEYAYGGDLPKAQYGPPGAFYNQAKAAEDQQARMAAAVGASQGNIPSPTPQIPYERVMPWTRPIRDIKNWWDRPLGQASPEEIRRQNLEVQRWAAEQRRKAEAEATATGSGTAQAKQELSNAEQQKIDDALAKQKEAEEKARKAAEKAKLTKNKTAANVAENKAAEAAEAEEKAEKIANQVIKGNTDEASEGPPGTDTKTDNTTTGTVRTVGDGYGYYGQPMGRFKLKGKVKEYDPLTGKMIKKTKIEPLKYDTAYGPQNVFGRRGPRVVKIPINQTYNINPFKMDLTPGSESFNTLYNTSRSSDAVGKGLTPEQIARAMQDDTATAEAQEEARLWDELMKEQSWQSDDYKQPGSFRSRSEEMPPVTADQIDWMYKGMQDDGVGPSRKEWREAKKRDRVKDRETRGMFRLLDKADRDFPLTDEDLNQMQNPPLKYGGMPEYQMAGSTFNLNNYQPGQFTEGFGPQEGGFGPMEKGFNLWETGESPYMSTLKETELEGKWKQKGLGQGWSMLGPGLTFLGDALNARQAENPPWAYTAGANKPILMANDADRGKHLVNSGVQFADQQVITSKYGGQRYQNGGTPKFVISPDSPVKAEPAQRYRPNLSGGADLRDPFSTEVPAYNVTPNTSRGESTINEPMFAPNPNGMTPNYGPVKMGGQMYQDGGEYELTDQEIQAIISAGGEVEFL